MAKGLFEGRHGAYLIQDVREVDGKYDPKSFPPDMQYIAFGTQEQLERIQARREGKPVQPTRSTATGEDERGASLIERTHPRKEKR